MCERRSGGERKYDLTNHPDDTPLEVLAASIKARWVCEQAHQQLKDELGLDHFEGRSWTGLHHHHAPLTLIAFAFLRHLRPRGKNRRRAGRAAARAVAARRPAAAARGRDPGPVALPALPAAHRLPSAFVNVAG